MRSGSPEFTRRIEFFTLRLDLSMQRFWVDWRLRALRYRMKTRMISCPNAR